MVTNEALYAVNVPLIAANDDEGDARPLIIQSANMQMRPFGQLGSATIARSRRSAKRSVRSGAVWLAGGQKKLLKLPVILLGCAYPRAVLCADGTLRIRRSARIAMPALPSPREQGALPIWRRSGRSRQNRNRTRMRAAMVEQTYCVVNSVICVARRQLSRRDDGTTYDFCRQKAISRHKPCRDRKGATTADVHQGDVGLHALFAAKGTSRKVGDGS
jgi:hypothetical protein